MSPARSLPVVAALLALAGCHVARPSELPLEPAWIVAVKSTRMPDGEPAITHFAHHSWIDVKAGDEQSWERVEVLSESSGVRRMPIGAAVARADRRWHDREVRLLGVLQGDEARAAVERIQGLAGELEQKYRDDYLAWPGPNSNTLLADIASETPELAFLLHHNAVGKDYPGWIAAGITTTRTGVHLDTLPLGFAIGLREGVELHLLQLTFGVSFWPPRLELPFLPEIPWSSSVDTPIVEAPRADQCIWLMDASWMSIVVGEEGLPEKASCVIEYAAAGAWTWLEYEWVAPDAAAPQGSLRIHERAHASGVTTESTRTIPWEPSGTAIHDSDFEGRRVKIVLTRLENGRFKPDVDVEEP